MPGSKLLTLFSSRPFSSAVLAALLLVLGLLFASGLVPTSSNRKYFTGHEWLLAMVCWVMSSFFGYCSAKGYKARLHKETE